MDIETLLKYGRENAVSTKQLIALTGLTEREVRRQIALKRRQGALIVSTSVKGNSGYFLPETKAEIEKYVKTQNRRAITELSNLKYAKKWLKEHQYEPEFYQRNFFDEIERFID